MKRTSILKRGNGFKKVVGNSLKKSPLKKSSFKRTLNPVQYAIRETDSRFSKLIINRDKKCLRCGSTSMLSCSHFYGRANYATRFEPMNCITLCIPCHQEWESKKETDYKDFMIEWLGEIKFKILEVLSKIRISRQESIKLAQPLLKTVDNNNDIQY